VAQWSFALSSGVGWGIGVGGRELRRRAEGAHIPPPPYSTAKEGIGSAGVGLQWQG